MSNRSQIRLLTFCVFLSGGVALILEAVYQKYLATLIGATTPAATIVLSTYFVGLTAGALLAPKSARRANLRLASLELFIAAWSALLALGFYRSYDGLGGWLARWSGNELWLALARWMIAAIWILPPTMAMGAHLPTVRAFLEERGETSPGLLTRLYAVNSAGACAFTLAAPFLFFYYLGLEGTLLLSAGIGLAVAAALLVGLRPGSGPGEVAPATQEHPAPSASDQAPPLVGLRWPLMLAALSGFVFFSLEVLWTHLISSVLGASTYSFSMLLAVVLLSLVIAGRNVEKRAPRDTSEVKAFLRELLASLAFGLPLTTLFWPYAGRALAVIGGELLKVENFFVGELLKLGVAYLLIKPVATLAGTLFPLTFHGSPDGQSPSSRRLGWLLAFNTVGAVSGAIVGGYLMIPLLGSERSFRLLWVIVVGLWLALLIEGRSTSSQAAVPRRAYGLVLAGVALVALAGS